MLTEAERLEVERVIHDAIGWALTKDIDCPDALLVRAGLIDVPIHKVVQKDLS